MDPVMFDQELRVTIQQIGVSDMGLFERQDDLSSVAYWYQTEPHGAFEALPAPGSAGQDRGTKKLLKIPTI